MPVRLRIPPHVVWNDTDAELVLFDRRDESYHALNGGAAHVWRAIAHGAALDDIASWLAERFDAPLVTIRRDVGEFVGGAVAKGLLESYEVTGA